MLPLAPESYQAPIALFDQQWAAWKWALEHETLATRSGYIGVVEVDVVCSKPVVHER